MSVGVIVVAAGRGQRLGGAVPKQLLEVDGRTLLRRSVDVFDGHPDVAELVVVLPSELVASGTSLVGHTARPCRFVAGGERRQDSVRHGLGALTSAVDLILIHDAARPFADRELVTRVIRATSDVGAAVPGVQSKDTVKRVEVGAGLVSETIPREEIWLVQTPQGFRRQILEDAVALGAADVSATDEAMLAERAGYPVAMVPGDERNTKITTAGDLARARTATQGTAPRVGTGYDLHRLVEGRQLVFAGVVVPFERGPHAHSDGDVICHALVDAMLGAAGAGDVGRHFPNTDPRWKDAAGLDLLARTITIVSAAGWRCVSADVTVVLERPKLAPHVDRIREVLAGALGVGVSAIGLKGKTNEGVDAVGRGEAVAAHAVAVLVPEVGR